MNAPSIFRPFAVSLLAATLAVSAQPETWLLGDESDRVAVVAVVPGDEARLCAGVLQECAAMDIPALVFQCAPGDAGPRILAAAGCLALPPDTSDLLSDPAVQLPNLLPAFAPSHVVLTRPDPSCLRILAGAFPDPATRPAVLVPADNPDAADWQFLLAPYQTTAKTAALKAYGLPAGADAVESFAEVELDDLPADAPVFDSAFPAPAPSAAPVRTVLPPPGAASAPEAVPAPPGRSAASAPAGDAPAPLRPRTRLPATPPPPKKYSSWADEPVIW